MSMDFLFDNIIKLKAFKTIKNKCILFGNGNRRWTRNYIYICACGRTFRGENMCSGNLNIFRYYYVAFALSNNSLFEKDVTNSLNEWGGGIKLMLFKIGHELLYQNIIIISSKYV